MHCRECGGTVADDAAFCAHCGSRLAAGDDLDRGNWAEDDSAGDDASPAERIRAGGQRGSGDEAAEAELWSGTFSPRAMVGPAIACAVVSVIAIIGVAAWNNSIGWTALLIGLLLIWGGLALTLLYRRLTVRYRLTTYRFFHDTGLLSRTGNRIEVIDVDDVTVRQGLIERFFGVGTLHIVSSDRTDPDLSLPGIDDVRRVADLVDSTRRAERHRRGLHIESI